MYDEFYVTVGAMGLYGLAYLLVQGGVIGVASEMPERYMQAVVASTTTLWLCVLGLKKERREQRNNKRERESWNYLIKRNDMSTIFLQKILSGRLLLVVIIEAKK